MKSTRSVAIADTGELIHKDAMEGLTDHGTVAILLGEATDPEINVSRAGVGGLKFFDDLTAMIHIFEAGDGTEFQSSAHFGKAGQAMIATTLNIE